MYCLDIHCKESLGIKKSAIKKRKYYYFYCVYSSMNLKTFHIHAQSATIMFDVKC